MASISLIVHFCILCNVLYIVLLYYYVLIILYQLCQLSTVSRGLRVISYETIYTNKKTTIWSSLMYNLYIKKLILLYVIKLFSVVD